MSLHTTYLFQLITCYRFGSLCLCRMNFTYDNTTKYSVKARTSKRYEFSSASNGELVLHARNPYSLRTSCKIETVTGTKLFKVRGYLKRSKVEDYEGRVVRSKKTKVFSRSVEVWKESNCETLPWLKVIPKIGEAKFATFGVQSGQKIATLN